MKPHRRWNPLKNQWILVSPQRGKRPWLGQEETVPVQNLPAFDPKCYLCPGNVRAEGKVNEDYQTTFIFDNDFPAVLPEHEIDNKNMLNGIISSSSERGICRVICFSPRHNCSLSQHSKDEVVNILRLFGTQYQELIAIPFIEHVMIFENKGEIMGCSNPHPHSQIWATEHLPTVPAEEIKNQLKYFSENNSSMLSDYCNWEKEANERVVSENAAWFCIVPYWASWPFETMIVPKRQVGAISELSSEEIEDWAAILLDLLQRYDALFNCSFPYSMGIYQSGKTQSSPGFTLNQKFFPPLLRSASIKKFMVGYELCCEPQRDLTPEDAAQRLRSIVPR